MIWGIINIIRGCIDFAMEPYFHVHAACIRLDLTPDYIAS